MYSEIILAGFGGQGVLLIGKLLAYAGLESGREVTWMPAYGPEMRGGTCNCTVVLSDRKIGSPISRRPHNLIALNLPSLDKFEDAVRPGGVIVINTSLVTRMPRRTDVTVIAVAANELAVQSGTAKAANMVALGALLGATEPRDDGTGQGHHRQNLRSQAQDRGLERGRPRPWLRGKQERRRQGG